MIKLSLMAETEEFGRLRDFVGATSLEFGHGLDVGNERKPRAITWTVFVAQVNMWPEQSLVNRSIGNHRHEFC